MSVEKETVFNMVNHTTPRGFNTYLMVVPMYTPSIGGDIQIAHLREIHDNPAFELSGGREFTVAWSLIPLVDNPERFINLSEDSGAEDGEDETVVEPSVEDYSKRAVCLVFGVSVYNSQDAVGSASTPARFFSKSEGRRRAIARLRTHLEGLREGNDGTMEAFSDHCVLEVASYDCTATVNDYLEIPRIGRFFYESVRQFVLEKAASRVSHELDRDFFSFVEDDENEPYHQSGAEVLNEKVDEATGAVHEYEVFVVGQDGREVPVGTQSGLLQAETAPESGTTVESNPADESQWPTAEEAKANSTHGGCGNCANCECDGAGSKA